MCNNENSECEQSVLEIQRLSQATSSLFLYDPTNEASRPCLLAFREFEVENAKDYWPFYAGSNMQANLQKMVNALCESSMNRLGVFTNSNEPIVWEYRRLFVGPGKKAAPPWGSVYTDKDCVIFGNSTIALNDWMALNGIKRHADPNMPADHIGLMLALMGWLAQNKPALIDDYLCNHLLTWAPHFLKLVKQVSQHAFYIALASLVQESLATLQKKRCLEVVEPKFYR